MTNPLLPEEPSPPNHYRLLIYRGGKKWLTSNQRGNRLAQARVSRSWRDIAAWLAFQGLRDVRINHAHVVCELRFATFRRRDPSNWAPTAKPVVDGLVDAGVFPDDDHTHVVGPDMRIGPSQPGEVLIVHIFNLEKS
jgi:crossover junction endodeoxyribonuclease RusA